MKIQKFEQSGFIITADSGYKIAIDIGNKTSLESLQSLNVDSFIVSHIHGDHFYLENIKALNPKNVYMNTECMTEIGEENVDFEINKTTVGDVLDIGDFNVTFFNVDHGPNVSSPLKENFGFLIKVDNQSIYFAGDMYNPSGIEVKDLEVDYTLIPVGSHYTFGPQEAYEFIKTFKNIKKVIPMHYEKNNFIDPIRKDEFIKLIGNEFELDLI